MSDTNDLSAAELLAASRRDEEQTAKLLQEVEPEFAQLRRWVEINHIQVKIRDLFREVPA